MRSEQFLRTCRLLGSDAVERLHEKRVIAIGLGAVGGTCMESLVRSGVGSFLLVDFDTVEITNLNRQILATYDTLGQRKTDAARDRIRAINPDCRTAVMPVSVSADNLGEVLAQPADLVIDAIDSVGAKCDVLEYCAANGIPVVSSMGAALRRDPSLVRTADLMDTYGCPLARRVRNTLRKRGVGRGIGTVFSPEEIRQPVWEGKEEQDTHRPLGSLPTVTAIFGHTLAHLALRRLLGDEGLSGRDVGRPTPARSE